MTNVLIVTFAVLLGVGALLTVAEILLARRLRRRQTESPFAAGPRGRAANDFRPAVSTTTRLSILKPLSGPEDGLEENLASFARLSGISYELIASVADPADPAIDVFRRVARRFPAAPFRLVTGGAAGGGSNPKVERLLAAAREATGELLLVSDANVRVGPGDVERTLRAFDDPAVGCVSNLFVGAGAKTLGARLESLHLLTFVVPGNVLAAWAGVPCVVGKSMAIRREVLDRIGGFGAFRNVLAEDQRIGLAVRAAGFQLRLSPVVVRNVVIRRTPSQALARQVRWGKMRLCFSPLTFAGEVLMMPIPLALFFVLGAAAFSPAVIPAALATLAGMAILRMLHALAHAAAFEAPIDAIDLLLVPVQEVLQFGGQVAACLSKEVSWRGHRARLGPGTILLPSRRAAATA